jgi:hypothetical protein
LYWFIGPAGAVDPTDPDRVAYPAWSDTRNPAPVLCPGSGTPGHPPRLCVTPACNAPYNNDQEIYLAAVRVPSG